MENNHNETDNNEKFALDRRSFLKTGAVGAAAGLVGLGSEKTEAQSLAWKQSGNNNHIIEIQESQAEAADGEVKLEYFGHCAFKVTSPGGVTMLFDPWRNDPSGAWGLWYPEEFPQTVVDIGMSTHAHFDHDALDRLDATMILDRMVGEYQFSDVKITGLADKHACEAPGWYQWTNAIAEFGASACPPDNPGHMDMSMYILETGGLRILVWGDNRHNPSEHVLQSLGEIDVLTLPVDGSEHILSHEQGDEIVANLAPKVVIPTHYLCEGVSLTLTTLQDADKWVDSQKSKTILDSGAINLVSEEVKQMDKEFMYFGSNTVIS